MGTMRAAIAITAFLAVASARTFSKKALSTPLARGGGRIVGGTDAYPGEFPHQIMLTRGVGGSLTLACTRTTTAGTSTTTFACSPSRGQSAWDLTLEQLACPPAWKSTPRAPCALSPDGEPPLRAAALPVSSRRSTSLLCLTSIAVTPTDRTTSLTP